MKMFLQNTIYDMGSLKDITVKSPTSVGLGNLVAFYGLEQFSSFERFWD